LNLLLKGINNTRKLIQSQFGSTIENIILDPKLSAKFVRAAVVLNYTKLYDDWRQNDVMYNSLVPQQKLTVLET
jgi:hypothetical protein